MTDQIENFPGSQASKGLPAPVLNELERLIDQEQVTEAVVTEKLPKLSEQLMRFYEREYHSPIDNVAEFTALVTAETWNYLYQLRDGEAAQNA